MTLRADTSEIKGLQTATNHSTQQALPGSFFAAIDSVAVR
jgi:hypothetical protein